MDDIILKPIKIMKESKYNKYFNYNGRSFVFNSMSGALAEINEDFNKIITNLENINYSNLSKELKEVFNNMIKGCMILESSNNELEILKYRYNKGRFDKSQLTLTIAPTLMCNFACPYCYETPVLGIMDEETQNSIINFIEKQFKDGLKFLSINWYGGEPLLAKNIIYSLSERILKLVENYNVEYDTFIITNGYLLDEECILRLINYKITRFQITIDGPSEIHNNRRKLKNGNQETFFKIITNIKLLNKYKLNTLIRVNIDRSNYQSVYELIDFLKENNIDNPISFGHVFNSEENCSIINTCLSIKEYSEVNKDLYLYIKKSGTKIINSLIYPSVKYNYCGADNLNVFVIDTFGYMYKCWNEVGKQETSFGNINNFDKLNVSYNHNYLKWFNNDVFEDDDCKDCYFLPICMGGCPHFRKIGKNKNCLYYKHNLEEYLKNFII